MRGLLCVVGCALGLLFSPRLAWAAPEAEPTSGYRFFLYPTPATTAEQGVANVTSAARLVARLLEELALRGWPAPPDAEAVGMVTRTVEWSGLQAPTAFLGALLSHELLGHGARARELGFAPSYQLRPPPPYSWPIDKPFGFTDYGQRALPTTLDEELLLILGGLEADELLLREVSFTGFRSDVLRQGDLLLYLTGKLHPLYMRLREWSDTRRFDDLLVTRYGDDGRSIRPKLEAAALLSLLDPLFIYGWYASVGRFIVQGERTHPYPAVELGAGVRLTGSYRPIPVPWGLEHQLEAMAGGELGNVVVRVRIGDGVERGSFAVSATVRDLAVTQHIRCGGSFELWSQPPLTLARELDAVAGAMPGMGALGPGMAVVREPVVGGAAELLGEIRFEPWSWGMAIGGKSAGLQQGHPIADDAYASVFAGVRF